MVCVILRFWAGVNSYNFHFIQFLLQDGRFRIGNDLILGYPYVRYFIDFNTTKHGIYSAFVVLNLSRGGPIQYNLYILLPAVTEAKSFVFIVLSGSVRSVTIFILYNFYCSIIGLE